VGTGKEKKGKGIQRGRKKETGLLLAYVGRSANFEGRCSQGRGGVS